MMLLTPKFRAYFSLETSAIEFELWHNAQNGLNSRSITILEHSDIVIKVENDWRDPVGSNDKAAEILPFQVN